MSLLVLVTAGVLVAGLFSTDSPDQIKTITVQTHRIASTVTFMLELTALFIFSIALRHHCRWRVHQTISLLLSVIAVLAIAVFIVSVQLDIAPDLTERMTTIPLLVS